MFFYEMKLVTDKQLKELEERGELNSAGTGISAERCRQGFQALNEKLFEAADKLKQVVGEMPTEYRAHFETFTEGTLDRRTLVRYGDQTAECCPIVLAAATTFVEAQIAKIEQEVRFYTAYDRNYHTVVEWLEALYEKGVKIEFERPYVVITTYGLEEGEKTIRVVLVDYVMRQIKAMCCLDEDDF